MTRPQPPDDLHREREQFLPAPELWEWIHSTFIDSDGPLFNPEHEHLADAEIDCLWTSAENVRNMRRIAGTAEIPNVKGARWQKARERVQLLSWFGRIPDFVLTFDALYCEPAEDIDFCALVEHELYHCGQKLDVFGSPRFGAEGQPMFALRGHDVEEHLGIVRRYGARGNVAELVRLAQLKPLVAPREITLACGTCPG